MKAKRRRRVSPDRLAAALGSGTIGDPNGGGKAPGVSYPSKKEIVDCEASYEAVDGEEMPFPL